MGNGEQDLLDFWLDVHQHRALCRAYFKDLLRTGTSLEQEWPDYSRWIQQHGSSYADVMGDGVDNTAEFEDVNLSRVDLLRDNTEFGDKPVTHMNEDRDSGLGGTMSSRERRDTESHGPHRRLARNPSLNYNGSPSSTLLKKDREPGKDSPERSNNRTSQGPAVIRKNQVVTQLDLFNSAERIYARYLMENAEKPVYFPYVSLSPPMPSNVFAKS